MIDVVIAAYPAGILQVVIIFVIKCDSRWIFTTMDDERRLIQEVCKLRCMGLWDLFPSNIPNLVAMIQGIGVDIYNSGGPMIEGIVMGDTIMFVLRAINEDISNDQILQYAGNIMRRVNERLVYGNMVREFRYYYTGC